MTASTGTLFDLFDDEAEAPEWQDRALCAQTDPEAFFPEKGGSTREAKQICQGCDVRAECLEYALAHDERFGIWGGLSERERRAMKKRNQITAASGPVTCETLVRDLLAEHGSLTAAETVARVRQPNGRPYSAGHVYVALSLVATTDHRGVWTLHPELVTT